MTRRAIVVAAFVAAAAAVVGVAPAPVVAQAAPTITVTPTDGLLDRHEVDVRVTGLVPGRTYTITECAVDACVDPQSFRAPWGLPPKSTPVSERFDPIRRLEYVAGPEGVLETTVSLRRQILVGWTWGGWLTRVVDCAAETCRPAVLELRDDTTPYDTPVVTGGRLTFAATGTYAWPAAAVTPTSVGPLTHGQRYSVAGSGFEPDIWDAFGPGDFSFVYGIVRPNWCRAGAAPPAGCEPMVPIADVAALGPEIASTRHLNDGGTAHGDDGAVTVFATADRFIRVSADEHWDCAVVACSVALQQARASRSPAIPVTFGDPWAPHRSPEVLVDSLALTAFVSLTGDERALLADDIRNDRIPMADAVLTVNARSQASVVGTLYSSLLRRRPDFQGVRFWVDDIRDGLPPSRMADRFANSPEVRTGHAALDDAAAVEWGYQGTLGRGGDPSGRAYWEAQLAAGLPRYRMLAKMALSPESRTRTTSRSLLTLVAYGLRTRQPTVAEWEATAPGPGAWVAAEDAVWTIIDASDLFRARP